ncbi:PRTase [Fusarium napiforme]|uniref:PRTase n=1 Tax=Fusarium napiforme TaxID=42672 RepID=A0A8H5NIK5_9HYPO|nr:PRTase [Fusarium napiforme]
MVFYKSPSSYMVGDPVDPGRPIVLGTYGIPGSGKSFILEHLRKDLGEEEFAFFEGSEVIASLVPGGLAEFQKLDEDEKYKCRVKAINHIKNEAITSRRVAVIFTHIIYLRPDEQTIMLNIESDKKDRSCMSGLTKENLRYWQSHEIYQLRHRCSENHILFANIQSPMPRDVLLHVRDFKKPATAEANIAEVTKRLDEIVALHDSKELQTFLVFDADRTLSAEDGGRLFMREVEGDDWGIGGDLVSDVFRGPMGYSDAAFRQATLLLEQKCNDEVFENHCNTVSASVPLRFEFMSLLSLVAQKKHIGAVVVTCGVGRLWTKVLERAGLADCVKVIGGGRFSSGYIVTPDVKAAVVSHLRDKHELYVWAFGDSPLDIPMLWEADQAIVVVGEKDKRSKTMDEELDKVIRDDHLRARQVLLPSTSSPRLDTSTLPVARIDVDFFDSIINRRPDRQPLKLFHATDKAAAKLLMSPMRDAAVFGPMLRQAHANVGRYLATEYVSELIGLEDYTIPHVQGHNTTGYYLRNEAATSIIALMRGGEPMAFGVSEVFPQAMFIHASSSEDVKMHHVQGQSNVILVDSVVNSGKSVTEFIKRVVRLEPNINITVVAGVVQAEAIAEGHLFAKVMRRHSAGVVALRVSENRFTGTKTTDTGNRLFNTTHLA